MNKEEKNTTQQGRKKEKEKIQLWNFHSPIGPSKYIYILRIRQFIS